MRPRPVGRPTHPRRASSPKDRRSGPAGRPRQRHSQTTEGCRSATGPARLRLQGCWSGQPARAAPGWADRRSRPRRRGQCRRLAG
eukprot:4855568-Alexandrium_andersonii.AAC.1